MHCSRASLLAHLKQAFLRSRKSRIQKRRRHGLLEVLERRTLLAAGVLDPSFGTAGVTLTDFLGSSEDTGGGIAIQADGKYVVVGGSKSAVADKDFAVARFHPDGSLDTTFGDNGRVFTHFAGDDDAVGVVIDSTGRIVVAGHSVTNPNGASQFAAARYLSDGTLDLSFGTGGKVLTDITPALDLASDVLIDTAGRIVITGTAGNIGAQDFGVVRYTADGSLDNSFGGDGIVTTHLGDTSQEGARGVVQDSSGRLVVVGFSSLDFALVRYNDNGTLDPSFSGDGFVKQNIDPTASTDQGVELAIDANGRIVTVGWGGGGNDFAIARFTENGSIDNTFDVDGRKTVDFSGGFLDQAFSVVIQPDNNIVVGGRTGNFDFALTRLNPSGAIDATFGNAGKLVVSVSPGFDTLAEILLDPTGRIIGAGIGNTPDRYQEMVLIRLAPHGTLDASFGSNGVLLADLLGSADDLSRDVVVQPDGKVIVAGMSRVGVKGGDFALARYLADGTPDNSFGVGGKVLTHLLGDDFVEAVALDASGRILVVGTSQTRIAVARYLPNGSLDTTFGTNTAGFVAFQPAGGSSEGRAIAILANGKILVGGHSAASGLAFDFALAKLNEDGSFDTSFGSGGKVLTDFGGTTDFLGDITVTPSGQIVAGGSADNNGSALTRDFAFAVYNPNGTLDTDFSGDGKLRLDFAGSWDAVFGVAIDSANRIVAGGNSLQPNSMDFAVVRLHPDGILDSSFDNDGKVTSHFGANEFLRDLVIDPAGGIVAVGYTQVPVANGERDIALARYTPNGAIDAGFGTGGRTLTDLSDGDEDAYGVALDAQSRILVAGESLQGRRGKDFAVLRFGSSNAPPTAVDDSYSVDEDGTLSVAPPSVLANDNDVNGDTLTAIVVNGPTHGGLTLWSDGTLVYTPNTQYYGADSFTYKANDGSADSNVATVSITVNPVNDAPTAYADFYHVGEDQLLEVPGPGVLVNDFDMEADALTAVLVSVPNRGNLTFNADGSFTYVPEANFHGEVSFTYKGLDGSAESNIETVTIIVDSINDSPVAVDDNYSLQEDVVLTVAAPGVLANDGDADGDALSALLVGGGPAHGMLTLGMNGSFTYTPQANFHGSDSFTYRLTDGSLTSNWATVWLTINSVQDPPVAVISPVGSVVEATAQLFDGSSSYDVDGDLLSYLWDFGDGGTATTPSPVHTYDDSGVYSVKLTVRDGQRSNSATMLVTVANVAPVGSAVGPGTGVRGQVRTFNFSAADVSNADQAGTFNYSINWGDGSGLENVAGSSSISRNHVFSASGSFAVLLTVRDKDGGASAQISRTITITPTAMQGNDLVVGGTLGADSIVVRPTASAGELTVIMNGVSQGNFRPTGQILVFGQSGSDQILVDKLKIKSTTRYVAIPAILDGGIGNDTLDARGSTAANVLLGGEGGDTLWGGAGRELLVGGLGADVLRADGGDDILIGGTTDFDSKFASLNALLAEWRRTDLTYQARIDHLTGASSGGLNGASFLTPLTVHDDAAVDQLYGEGNQDWFLYHAIGSSADILRDRKSNERTTQT